jgi:Uma2 family endonuclease
VQGQRPLAGGSPSAARALVFRRFAQNPLTVPPDSEPQPDIIRYRAEFFAAGLPGVDDLPLVIEVADTSLRYDRRVKGQLYAEAGIRDSWIVDLADDVGDVYRARRRRHPRLTVKSGSPHSA